MSILIRVAITPVEPEDLADAEKLVRDEPAKAVAIVAAATTWWAERTGRDGGERGLMIALNNAFPEQPMACGHVEADECECE